VVRRPPHRGNTEDGLKACEDCPPLRQAPISLSAGPLNCGEAEGVEEPLGAAVVTVFGEELTQLGVDDGAALAEELIAYFE